MNKTPELQDCDKEQYVRFIKDCNSADGNSVSVGCVYKSVIAAN